MAREKFAEQAKGDLDRALDALMAETKSRPGALEAWRKYYALIAPDKQTEAAA